MYSSAASNRERSCQDICGLHDHPARRSSGPGRRRCTSMTEPCTSNERVAFYRRHFTYTDMSITTTTTTTAATATTHCSAS